MVVMPGFATAKPCGGSVGPEGLLIFIAVLGCNVFGTFIGFGGNDALPARGGTGGVMGLGGVGAAGWAGMGGLEAPAAGVPLLPGKAMGSPKSTG